MPPLWPLVGTVFLLLGIMLLVWGYLGIALGGGAAVCVGVIFGLTPLLSRVGSPYLLIVIGALGVLRYCALQPATSYWQAVQLCMVAAIGDHGAFCIPRSVGLMLVDEGYLWMG
jgi:hypothetical protein